MSSPLPASRRGNRRLTARVTCQLTVRYRVRKDWHPTMAVNLSPYGCSLRLGEDLPTGTVLTVVFEQPEREGISAHRAEVEGVVIWCRHEGISHLAGVHFRAQPAGLHEILASLG